MDMQSREQTFQMWEIFWANLRMYLKMHLHFIGLLAIAQSLLFTTISWFFLPTLQRQLAEGYIFGIVGRFFYYNPTFNLDLPNGTHKVVDAISLINSQKAASAAHLAILWGVIIFLASCSIYLLLPLISKRFAKKGEEYFADEHLRGVRMRNEEFISDEIKKSGEKCNIMLGNVPWPHNFEPEHLIIYGKTRVGKTVAMFQFLAGLRAKKAKAMILDIKLDYIMKWFSPALGDQIFNILDARSIKWNIFNEIKTVMDVDAVASSIIPDAKGGGSNEAFFNEAARAVLVGGLHACIAKKQTKTSVLREMIYQDTGLLHDAIEKTRAGQRGAQYIQQPASALAGSVIAVLTQYCGWLDYCADANGEDSTFSFVDWLTDCKGGFLYIASNDEVEKILRPVISLAFDLIARKVNSLPDDRDNRIYLCMDEFGSLQRLSAIVPLLTKGGGKGLICVVTTQDFSQTKETYGDNLSKTINNSFGTVMTLKLKDPDTSEYLSKTTGRREYKEWQKTHTMKTSDDGDGSSLTQQKRDEAVITATEIQYLKKLEYVLQIPDYEPCRGKLKILPINEIPKINEGFVLRDGLTLSEVYAKQAEIEKIERVRGMFIENEVEIDEKLEETVTATCKKSDQDDPAILIENEAAGLKLF